MNGKSRWPLFIGGALLLYALYASQNQPSVTAPEVAPVVKPAPRPKPKQNPQCPSWGLRFQSAGPATTSRKPQLGGLASPDGAVRAVYLPDNLEWPENISSPPRTPLGCCGFRVIDYQARFQNYPALVDLPEHMVRDRIPGGAEPWKVARVVAKYAPDAHYFQDCSKSWKLLEACVKSQRIPGVDYNGRDPHYSVRIAHCVNVVACDIDKDWIAILDNNHPSTDEIVWMGTEEFSKRWGGWLYGLLDVAPGHCAGSYPSEKYRLNPAEDGTFNFGLSLKGNSYPAFCQLDNVDSTPEAILAVIGPAMAPIKLEVDHKMEPFKLDFTPLTIALAGGAVLLFSQFSQRKD